MTVDRAGGSETFESRLHRLLVVYAPAPWHARAPEGAAGPIIERLLDPATPLVAWRNVVAVLEGHGMPAHHIAELRPLYLEAGRRRRPRNPILDGHAASERAAGPVPAPVPALEDAGGLDLKPDPLTRTPGPADFHDLDALLLRYWAWAGRPSSRKLAAASGGVFSHATVNRLTGPAGRAAGRSFSVRQEYVRAFIAACGGSEDDQRRWVTAWRQVDEACS
ncbi:hypothetical protein [Actinomadura roseirufa]|uniref:hypothetical protein n=1 Tax=Actinomadura roseirufa TaxID=2094049 RepID=UPI0010416838|nr:hypothetical protein [Actinomadura roseirufa]